MGVFRENDIDWGWTEPGFAQALHRYHFVIVLNPRHWVLLLPHAHPIKQKQVKLREKGTNQKF